MDKYRKFRIESIPSRLEKSDLINAIGGDIFWVFHKMGDLETFVGMTSRTAKRIEEAIVGFHLNETDEDIIFRKPVGVVAFLYKDVNSRDFEEKPEVFADLYKLFGGTENSLCLCFTPVKEGRVLAIKRSIEHLLSTKEIRQTTSLGDRSLSSSSTKSLQTDIYYGSEERKVLLSVLETLNDITISNYMAYNVLIVCEDDAKVLTYLSTKLHIIDKFDVKLNNDSEIFDISKTLEAMPFSFEKIFPLISFSEKIERIQNIKTEYPRMYAGYLEIGTYLEDSLKSLHQIKISYAALNLGCLITGLPGSGKTFEAMNLCMQVKSNDGTKIAILAPTDEWRGISGHLNLEYLRVYESAAINFFKCDSDINIEKFYENLAMLISSSSAAGPYKNSLEKCLLAAFRKIYTKTRSPDPLEVYDTIEKVIVEQHGVQVSSGVKYTKHGENIRAALENLRLLLFRDDFSSADGIDFGKLISSGVVFDLSLVGSGMKPLLYGLILNQLYSFSDALDTKGDNELRMFLLVEEAQLIFPQDDLSGATLDLKQRIQDFRKKGVGIVLVTHNVVDINSNIRRLCQNKLYFRQSVDVSKYAGADLGFAEEQKDTVMRRLKNLEQQVCAASLVEKNRSGNRIIGPMFIKASRLDFEAKEHVAEYKNKNPVQSKSMRIMIHRPEGKTIFGLKLVLNHLWEVVGEAYADEKGAAVFDGVKIGKRYIVRVFDPGKGKPLKSIGIIAQENLEIHT